MAKVLSANVTAGIATSSTPVFLIEIESSTTLYRWATFPCNASTVAGWTGPDFESKIAERGLGKIRRAIDIREGGNVSQVQKWSFKILNQGLISDTLAAEKFIGRRAEIRLIFIDQTAPSWMNAVPVAPVSFLEDFDWDEDSVKFYCVDGWMKRHRDLPKKEISYTDFLDAPNSNIRKPYPILYGDWMNSHKHKSGISYINVSGTPDFGNRDNYFKGLMVKKSAASGSADGEYLFAGHLLHTWDEHFTGWLVSNYSTPGGNIYLDAALGGSASFSPRGITRTRVRAEGFDGWCLSDVFDGTEDVSSGSYLRIGCTNSDYYLFKRLYLVPLFVSQTGTTTGENCIDEDSTNTTLLTAGQGVTYRIHRKDLKEFLGGGSGACKVQGEVTYSGSLVNDKLTITVSKPSDVSSPSSLDITTSSAVTRDLSVNLSALGFDFTDDNYDYIDIALSAVAVTGDDGGTWNVKNLYLFNRIASSDGMEEVYGCGKGRMFGSWIDSPDHSNAKNEGDLIENPVYMIESLLCEPTELNLTVKRYGAAIQTQDDAVNFPYFEVPHSASLALTGIVSIECWVKFISFVAAGENFITAKVEPGGVIAPYGLSVSTGGKIRFWRGNGTTSSYLESATTLSTGVWYHILAVANGGAGTQRYIYINGVLDSSHSSIQAIADGASVLRIGLRAGALTRTNMILDELRIWDRVITEGESLQLYNGGAGYPKPYYPGNTKAWWRFDEEGRLLADASTPSGAFTATDSSGNGNDAASNNHANMRWVTGASAKVLYTESQVEENNAVSGAQSSFDVIAGLRSSWLFARQFLEKQNSLDMIRDICRDAHIGYFANYLGEETVARIDLGAASPAPATITKFLLQGDKTSFHVKRGPLKLWYNEFVLHYKPNVATGEPEETLFVNTPDASAYAASYTNLTSDASANWTKCKNVYTDTLQVNRWEYTAKNIRDAATAELMLKEIITHFTRRPFIVDFKTGLELIAYEPLDIAKIAHALLPEAISGSSRFRLIEQDFDPNECEITSTFYEVGINTDEPT